MTLMKMLEVWTYIGTAALAVLLLAAQSIWEVLLLIAMIAININSIRSWGKPKQKQPNTGIQPPP